MRIVYSKRFEKRLNRLSDKLQSRFFERMEKFIKNPNNPILRNHPLKGNLIGYRSFSVTGDYRVTFRFTSESEIKLIDIGTHNQVY